MIEREEEFSKLFDIKHAKFHVDPYEAVRVLEETFKKWLNTKIIIFQN